MKSSLKTYQLRLCSTACEMSYTQVQMLRTIPSINDSNRIMGQMNDAVRWDSRSPDEFRAGSSFADQQTWPFLNHVGSSSALASCTNTPGVWNAWCWGGEVTWSICWIQVPADKVLSWLLCKAGAEWDSVSKQTWSGASKGFYCLEKLNLALQVAYTPFSHKSA